MVNLCSWKTRTESSAKIPVILLCRSNTMTVFPITQKVGMKKFFCLPKMIYNVLPSALRATPKMSQNS